MTARNAPPSQPDRSPAGTQPTAASGKSPLRPFAAAPPQKRPRVLGTLLVVYLIWLVGLSWLAILVLQGE